MYNLIAPGKEVIMNSIKIIGDEKEGSSKDNIESSEPKTYLKLNDIAIFKDDKFVSWTTEEESYGINIINNKIRTLLSEFLIYFTYFY
jgi:spore germination protein KC